MKPFPIAIVTSRFNEKVTQALYQGACDRLKELNVPENLVRSIWVPGAVEIPLIVKQFAKSNQFKAILALGAVIRGETTHYDYVCQQVSDGCQQVMLQYDTPVIFGVLTTENAEQAFARSGGAKGNKGAEAVDAAFEMVAIMEELI